MQYILNWGECCSSSLTPKAKQTNKQTNKQEYHSIISMILNQFGFTYTLLVSVRAHTAYMVELSVLLYMAIFVEWKSYVNGKTLNIT